MRRIILFIVCYGLAVAPVAARMYQWRNPATGTTQMSGTPPAWYRSAERGPRVYVFENNQLVDDTGIAVSDERREALRAAAFGAAAGPGVEAQDRPADAPPAAAKSVPPVPSAAPDVAHESPAKVAEDGAGADKAAALKALIDAWDQRQLDQARTLLDMLPADGKTPAAHP